MTVPNEMPRGYPEMKASGTSTRPAPPAAASAASFSTLASVAVQSNTTGAAWTTATRLVVVTIHGRPGVGCIGDSIVWGIWRRVESHIAASSNRQQLNPDRKQGAGQTRRQGRDSRRDIDGLIVLWPNERANGSSNRVAMFVAIEITVQRALLLITADMYQTRDQRESQQTNARDDRQQGENCLQAPRLPRARQPALDELDEAGHGEPARNDRECEHQPELQRQVVRRHGFKRTRKHEG